MTRMPAGTEVEVTRTYLEMSGRPGYDRPSVPLGPPTVLIRAETPPAWYFLQLYTAVGGAYEWVDWLSWPVADVEAIVQDPKVELYTLMRAGWTAGFFMLDRRTPGKVEIAYFGLVPEAVGQGLGGYLLKTAIHLAWDGEGVETVWLHTCTLDHPSALAVYQKCGFSPVGQERYNHVLTRDRDMPMAQGGT